MPNNSLHTIEQPLKEEGKITKITGKPKPDASRPEYKNIPLLVKPQHFTSQQAAASYHKQTIEEYFEREVKPHLPDAWVNHDKIKIGYEINFTKYFYEFKPLRPFAAIQALEEKTLEIEKTIKES